MWWQKLKAFLLPPETLTIYRLLDFTKPALNHWIRFDGGDNNNAMFTARGEVHFGDYILVRCRSGRVGRYRCFSVRPDFTGEADYKIQAVAIGYWSAPTAYPPKPIKGLLGDGTRWVRSDKGELAHLPSGFTKPASEFWKILARNEACNRHSSRIDSTGNMHVG